jgi:hypothetical protein
MLRIPFRYLLPLLVVMLTAALYFVGRQQQQGIDLRSWDGPPPRPIEIAVALNVPAVIAALPGGLLLELATGGIDHLPRARWYEIINYSYLAAFVFGQWFLIGRWLDRRRGLVPPSSSRSVPSGSRIVHVVALLGSLFFVCFGILLILHSGWMSSWISGAGITAWSSIATIVLVLRLRKLHSQQRLHVQNQTE